MRLQKLVISCGGTGGHFYPGLSVARTLREQGGEVLLLLSGVNAEKQKAVAESYGVPAVALPRMPSPHGIGSAVGFLRGALGGYSASRRELRHFQPQALLGMGSFTSLPPVLAARRGGIPVFLHDGNARIGRANRFFSRWARLLATAFPPCNVERCNCEHMTTGMPLRPELERASAISRDGAIAGLNREFGVSLDLALPTVLVFGGSQGASIFNGVLPEALRRLRDRFEFQVLHLAGPKKLEEARAAYGPVDFPLLLLESSEKMELFLGAADLVVSRSGGSTVAELALFGRASMLIPYPYAAENHQFDNARYLSDPGAAELVPNDECTPERMEALLAGLLADSGRLKQRGLLAAALAAPAAAERLLSEISDRLPPPQEP